MTDAFPFAQDEMLGILARAQSGPLEALAEEVLPQIPDIEVLHNRTGLVMLPMRDTAKGTAFHLGEVLVSEAHIKSGSAEGYGMRRGRGLQAAMAMAVIDLAVTLGIAPQSCVDFLSQEAAHQRQTDDETLRSVEATRVDMETF